MAFVAISSCQGAVGERSRNGLFYGTDWGYLSSYESPIFGHEDLRPCVLVAPIGQISGNLQEENMTGQFRPERMELDEVSTANIRIKGRRPENSPGHSLAHLEQGIPDQAGKVDEGADGVVAPLPPVAIPKIGARLGRIMTRKGSNVDAGDVATKWPRSSIREKNIRGSPEGLKWAYVCA